MTICAIRRQARSAPPDGVLFIRGLQQLDDVLSRSDFVAVTLSLAPQTRGLLYERRLRLMRPTAYLINAARAEIIDETALYGGASGGGSVG